MAIIALRGWALTVGLVDRPSNLKTHYGQVPLVGGLGIAVALMILVLVQFDDARRLPFALACLVVVAVGTLDDLRSLPALPRIMCQIAAALIMVNGAGLGLTDLGNLSGSGELIVGAWGIPLTVFCAVGVMNAMNMIDGLDGLAGGISAVALFWLFLGATATGLNGTQNLAGSLLPVLAGFLLFNFPLPWRLRASVFLGDAGSLLLGLILAWCTIDLSQNAPARFYPISAVWILGVPLCDAVYTIVRRLVRLRNPFQGDRQHIHHTLLCMGLSHGQTLAVLLGLSMAAGAVGYLGWYHRVAEHVLLYGFLTVFALYCALMETWRSVFRFFGLQLGETDAVKKKPGTA